MKNSFVKQFDQNIKFNYSCFDRVVLRLITSVACQIYLAGNAPFCYPKKQVNAIPIWSKNFRLSNLLL
jgi:hypothetical protein